MNIIKFAVIALRKSRLIILMLLSPTSAVFSQQLDVCTAITNYSEDEILPSLKDTIITRGTMDISKCWSAGSSIRVKFLNGDTALQSKVIFYANVWSLYGNIFFEKVTNGDAEIRVFFDSTKGNNSPIGIDLTRITKSLPTTYFSFTLQSPESNVKRHVLHEFGHMLGLLHENSSPIANIDWNKDTVYKYYKKVQGWSNRQVDENVFRTYEKTFSNGLFDTLSIMCYSLPSIFTISKKIIIGNNMELSDGDKNIINQMYPQASETASSEDPKVKYTITCNPEYSKNMFVFKPVFELLNGNGFSFKLGAYFFDEKGIALNDKSNINRSKDGQVVSWTKITPCCKTIAFASSGKNQIAFTLPTAVLPIKNGKNVFKYQFILWSGNTKIYCSPKYNIEFING